MEEIESDFCDAKVCRIDNEKRGEFDIYAKKLDLKIGTWFLLYKCIEKFEDRAEMRDVSIQIAETFRGDETIVSEHGSFAEKFAAAAPYYFFLSTVDNSKKTGEQPFSVSFHEILDCKLGEIVESLHLNYMVEMLWLTIEYMLAAQNPKMTVIYGLWMDPNNKYDIPFEIDLVDAGMHEFGCHHSKISILKYKDNRVRIIISTANLYYIDWQTRTQGFWVSPFLPILPEDADETDGESPTNFKKDFIEYLSQYKQPVMFGWVALAYRTDFSAVNVFFAGSVPGNHIGPQLDMWGHKRICDILSKQATLPDDAHNWPVVAQTSAVGVFGESYESWLLPHIVHSLSKEKDKKIIHLPKFKFIYPSQNNFNKSYDARLGATCLMYNEDTYVKQRWLKDYLYQWKCTKTKRTFSMPHSKCYTRISPDETEIPWFILTSANLSKGAWGKMARSGSCLHISNYEAGVVFIPQIIINQTTFPIKESPDSKAPVFLLPYDLPLTPYESDDEPFYIVRPKEQVDPQTTGEQNEASAIPSTNQECSKDILHEDEHLDMEKMTISKKKKYE